MVLLVTWSNLLQLQHHFSTTISTQEGVEEVIATIAPFLSVSGGSIELIERLSEEIYGNLTGSTPPNVISPGNSALIRGSWWLI